MIKEKTKSLLIRIEKLREKIAQQNCATQKIKLETSKAIYINYITNSYKYWRVLGEQKIDIETEKFANDLYEDHLKYVKFQKELNEKKVNVKKLELLIKKECG